MELRTCERLGETVRNVVTSRDICIVNVPCIDSFTYVVMLDVNMFCMCMKRWVVSQNI